MGQNDDQEEILTFYGEICEWIEREDYQPHLYFSTEEELVELLLEEVKEEAIEDDVKSVKEGRIKDEDIKELIKVVLTCRKHGLKKNEIKKRVEYHFDKKYGYQTRRSRYGYYYKRHNWNLALLYSLFEIAYSWMPPYPRGKRRSREYPIEKMRKLRAEGLSYREIAKRTGIPKSTVHRLLTKG